VSGSWTAIPARCSSTNGRPGCSGKRLAKCWGGGWWTSWTRPAGWLTNLPQAAGTASEQFEYRFRRNDGTSFWALTAGSPVRERFRRAGPSVGDLITTDAVVSLGRNSVRTPQRIDGWKVTGQMTGAGGAPEPAQGM
jgi:PAS domain-containing protein